MDAPNSNLIYSWENTHFTRKSIEI